MSSTPDNPGTPSTPGSPGTPPHADLPARARDRLLRLRDQGRLDVPDDELERLERLIRLDPLARGMGAPYIPGHALHPIQGSLAARQPWGWRAGVLGACDGEVATVDYLFTEGSPVVWHSTGLADAVPGTPVRLHEGLHVLDLDGAWLSVLVTHGLGPVPTPEHPDLWAAQVRVAPVIDVAAGTGIADVPHEA